MQSALELIGPSAPGAEAVRSAQRADAAALVEALRRREGWAPAALFDRYARHVRAIVLHVLGPRHEVSDLVHDVFVTAFADLSSLHKPEAMKGWLSSIAVFQAKEFLRRRRRFRLLSTAPDARVSLPAPPATPDVSAALHTAYELLDQLTPDERIPFVLRTVQGLRMEEVAEACGVSLATAKRRVARAAAKFRKLSSREPILRDWLGDSTCG